MCTGSLKRNVMQEAAGPPLDDQPGRAASTEAAMLWRIEDRIPERRVL
jgi:hypothetical protein